MFVFFVCLIRCDFGWFFYGFEFFFTFYFVWYSNFDHLGGGSHHQPPVPQSSLYSSTLVLSFTTATHASMVVAQSSLTPFSFSLALVDSTHQHASFAAANTLVTHPSFTNSATAPPSLSIVVVNSYCTYSCLYYFLCYPVASSVITAIAVVSYFPTNPTWLTNNGRVLHM